MISNDSDELLLLAYMDNELQPKQRHAFEKRLSEEPQLRQRLSEFEKTWNALGFLETFETNPEQVYSSLELISLRAKEDAKSLAARQNKFTAVRSFILWTLLFLLAFLGYQTVNRLSPVGEKQKIDDLRLIERLDQYYLLEKTSPEIDEIEFLRQLHESKILD
ncbi:MAG: hypothetical protein FWC43_02225 [Planctomycetaceae bacterium]|nr:hypothetical protein [Planctomycetaceae bacterium]